MRIAAFFMLFLISTLLCSPEVFPWNEDETHPPITDTAVKSASTLDAFLKEHLDYAKGIDTPVENAAEAQSKKILEWVKHGSTMEDYLVVRAFNHFHDPLKDWEEAGLSFLDGLLARSNLAWSQLPFQDSGSEAWTDIGGDYSWPDVRNYYYQAFTAQAEADREQNLADLFRGVGNLMHLVQDMAVPLHTRNDIHAYGRGKDIEAWAMIPGNLDWALSLTPQMPPAGLWGQWKTHPEAPYPVSALWDVNNWYGMLFPEGQEWLGMAEYSNANFFSFHSIGGRLWHQRIYHHPLEAALARLPYDDPEGGRYLRNTTSDGALVFHLARYRRKAYDLTPAQILADPDLARTSFRLDNTCYEEYAAQLIPKAVGYSGALVDYFFRGKLSVRAVILGAGDYGVQVRNDSAETMAAGTLTVGRLNEVDGTLAIVTAGVGPLTPGAWSAAVPIDDLVGSAADLNSTFHFVYRGQLGEEEDAVAVRVVDGLPILEERWSPSEGLVFRYAEGSSGTIPGDLGNWRYKFAGDQMSELPCNSRIEVVGGQLQVYECHHSYGDPPQGYGSVRVWLENFAQDQERIPLERLDWDCNPAQEDLGEGGHSDCFAGFLDGGMTTETGAMEPNGDRLCLRALPDGGSLYLGMAVLNKSVAEETNSSTMSIDAVTLTPSVLPEAYPPAGATELVETWQGVTDSYQPFITAYDPFSGVTQGEVRIPGDFGTWVFLVNGDQINVGDCDTQRLTGVDLSAGEAVLKECHHDFFLKEANWRFWIEEPYGNLRKQHLEEIAWTMSQQGALGAGGHTDFGIGLEDRALYEHGSIATDSLPLRPSDELKLRSDSYGPLLFRLALHTEEASQEINTTTATVSGLTLHVYQEGEGGAKASAAGSAPARTPPPEVLPAQQEEDPAVLARCRELERGAWRTHNLIDYGQL